MVHLINFGKELSNHGTPPGPETIIGKCAKSTNFYMRDNTISGALILEHVSEIMADTCNVNTRQKKNIK